ncbi:hypothetical protein DFH09DRAFT_908252 [Mycena vulgaris]|nr:hypothetical protein DFH09DRAFT_908252 [Mycena vulgaris]
MYFSGCFALLFFDFFLTLGDEVDYVWKAKKTPKPILPDGILHNHIVWYVERPALFVHPFILDHSIHFSAALTSRTSCNRFAIVEWLQTLLIVVPAEVVLLLRVYALAARNKYLLGFLISIVVVECVIVFYAMSLPGTNDAPPCHLPRDTESPPIVCILYSDPKMDTAYLSTSIAFDSIVFAITIAYTVSSTKHQSRPSILDTIRWDGTLYFCVILSGNVVWMALAVNGRPGLKLLNAQCVARPCTLIRAC